MRFLAALSILLLILGWTIQNPMASARAASLSAVVCDNLVLHPAPGLHPPSPQDHVQVAPDSPRGTFTVSLPLYPAAHPLSSDVASPYGSFPDTAYLHTASAEYATPDSVATVADWLNSVFPQCGWQQDGSWETNASIFTQGLTFVSANNPDLTAQIALGNAPSGGAYLGYGVEETIYPARPAGSYIHGPFIQLNLAVQHNVLQNGGFVAQISHVTVVDRAAIARLVQAINSVRDYFTVPDVCPGGAPGGTGPIWFSFVRPGGSTVHAFESMPGVCGGLAVNGFRWLLDPGQVWSVAQSLTSGRG